MGYIGCVSAACLARLGHRVFGIDVDAYKVSAVTEGRPPFYEPGLEELLAEAVASGALTATTNADEALAESEIALICVGTPSAANGSQSTAQIERVCRDVARHLENRGRPLTVAVRSTVFPGSCEDRIAPALASPLARLVSHPEFLREGSAVRDFFNPALLVVGGDDEPRRQVADIYAELDVEPCLVELRTAEMIKYSCNAFHAFKIAFANEIGELASAKGVSGAEVMATLCRDRVLNISDAYLKPGFAFGGSCLPKDLRALRHAASRLDLNLPLLNNVLASNEEHLNRAVDRVLRLEGKIGFYGLAFKEDTDDLRESAVVALLERLIGKGRDVRVYDSRISLEAIFGSNESFLLKAIPHIGRLLEAKLESALEWADHIVVAQKPNHEHAQALRASGKPLLSLVGQAFDPSAG